MKGRELRCPRCGSARIVPIIYGYPTEDALEMAGRGEAVLGGCLVFDDAPNAECGDCRRQFSTRHPPSSRE